jgi:adenosylmethionine-8-amino-7-oxononanoate aminotransferase
MRNDSLHQTQSLPKVARGKGAYLWDVDGKQYIDGSGGPAVYCLGHGNEEVNEAIHQQLSKIAHGYRYHFTSDPLEELTEIVARACGAYLKHMVFVTGGSEAVESALKLALQYQTAIGQKSRRKFIARERSWHGNTLGALSVSGFLERKTSFEGALLDVVRLSPVNAYRPLQGATAETVAETAARELEDAILKAGAHTIAAFIFEPVVGAAGGCVPAPAGYVKRVREICDRHGVVMIADEVMCGAGRTGHWRATIEDGAAPDIMTVAKGLAGGYLPLGAAVYSTRISEAIITAHGAIQTGHTFTGHTACCAAGVAVQKIVARDGLVERVKNQSPSFVAMLKKAVANIAEVGDIRGRGYFIALELVQDKHTKQPFPAELKLFNKVRAQALETGLICYPVGGNVDGIAGDIIILAPPYNATQNELAEIVEKTARSLQQILQNK